jgi:hypothetical protein
MKMMKPRITAGRVLTRSAADWGRRSRINIRKYQGKSLGQKMLSMMDNKRFWWPRPLCEMMHLHSTPFRRAAWRWRARNLMAGSPWVVAVRP